MPGAPRFTQKPSIQQTAQGDLLMECHLEADPPPDVRWHHAGTPILASSRAELKLDSLAGNLYKAMLIIKEPNAADGGAYKCTAANKLGESNANINLNFAGGEERAATPSQKGGPTFVGKPRIIPKDGGALILMECKVKSNSCPTAKWSKDGTALSMGALYNDLFTDLGDGTFLCQLEIKRPTANEAGQYRCNIRNEQGETNANLSLNFQQEEATPSEGRRSPSQGRGKSPKPGSRASTPSKKHREGTPSRRHKSREGSPKKSVRSRTATPTKEMADGNTLQPEAAGGSGRKSSKSEAMDTSESGAAGGTKRKGDSGLPPAPKRDRSRSKSPAPPKQAAAAAAAAATGPEAYKKAPVVTQSLKPKTGHTGETVVLECEWQCHSSTKITWSKDGKTIESSSEYSSTFNGQMAQLSINKMSETKAGLYKCTAKSEYGEGQSSTTVKYELIGRFFTGNFVAFRFRLCQYTKPSGT